ncbi:DUF1878 family protein [Pontibacillus chungwhensis]|uniref:DUF1878 family protein n=2 Tax=Pontibacillus TaxID=289201 RepID=A0ABY8V090_9BACI|nr:DUF1878 family protein [Pontibacillus chungwhensis]MCD5324960.1 YhaI family protein [Pontibacillus sp. HN14]WIF98918.1 DUF1878 family protein [Pontibacillus chungwhensis]
MYETDVNTKKIAFHVQLLANSEQMKDYPFTKMLIERGVTEEEWQEVMALLATLDARFHEEAEEGLLDFTPLLIHFAGMLNMKLHPDEAILAIKKEGYYSELMIAFEHVRRGTSLR